LGKLLLMSVNSSIVRILFIKVNENHQQNADGSVISIRLF